MPSIITRAAAATSASISASGTCPDKIGGQAAARRRSAAEWERALCAAGFVDVEVEERTVATRYASAADAERRLAAAWPPILSGHVPAADVDALVAAAAQVMIEGGSGLMTSRLLEFSACVPSVVK